MKISINFAFVTILTLFFAQNCSGKNILFYWLVSGYSHRISAWPIVEKLVEKGHNVTFLSPMPHKKPNPKVHEIVEEDLFKHLGLDVDLLQLRLKEGPDAISKLWGIYFNFSVTSCDFLLNKPTIVEWINNSSYDLVLVNGMFNECGYGLAHKFKSPVIVYSTVSHWGWFTESFGYPDENHPEMVHHYSEDMTFLQSVHNALMPLYWQYYRTQTFPKVEAVLKDKLQLPDLPPIVEIERNVSLVFVNSHFSEEFSRSFPPLFVPIGGIHCNENTKPLPEDIRNFVESGNDGFIYFSFGTFASIETLPQKTKDTFFKAMGSFKENKFLVKWVGKTMKNLPENIKIVPWVSQQDVLAHPKIRMFISHGGLLGTQEAIFHSVPMIVVPLFADQDLNAARIHDRGRGIRLEFSELTQETLENAIREILTNSTYKETCKKFGKLFSDRPQKPVDTAIWWLEYVLRHNDTLHLRPIGISKTWYERRMLHVWGFIALIVLGLVVSISLITCALIKSLSRNSDLKMEQHTDKRKSKKSQ